MYLKRLEIQGFKSFATRTVFEFGPGMTAVIGPNGSGKSNIADAVRWVLGEQNPRIMRLRRSEDALFAGGHKRAPAGLVEVSLWLDNTEGWLPVSYDEVVVTRRLHRSGDSEYLLNRNRVRLRDVTDLFLRAHVGQNSYALMGQGLVDQVLSLKPEERRALLEEAAEVRRYQVRIEEARDRLAATQDNLEKVDLIVSEIAPRLTQLERAARRAQEHGRLAEDLAEALNAWYGVQWRQREESLVAARAAYDQHNAEFVAASAEGDQLDSRVAAVRADSGRLRSEVEEATEKLRALREQARAAEQRTALDEERLGFVRRRLDELRAEVTDLDSERDDLRATLTGDGTADGGVDRVELARAALKQHEVDLAAAEHLAADARRALAEAEAAERREVAALRDLDERLARLDRQTASTEREAPSLLDRQTTLLARLKEIGRETLQLRRVTVLTAREVERADGGRAMAVHRLEEARDAVAAAGRTVVDLRHAVDEQTRRFALLEQIRDQFRRIDPGAETVLKAATDPAVDGRPTVLGLLGELLRVPKGMEAAIEAALAEHLSAVVVPHGRDAVAALRILYEAAGGRATLIPLDSLRPVPTLNLAKEKGVLGVAARFIRCDPRYRELVDTLLGRVVIVDDLETGRMMLKRGLNSVVTVDGVVLRAIGSITGGRNVVEGSRFSLEREIEEIPTEIDRLLGEQEQQAQHVEALKSRVLELEGALAAATEEVGRAERRYAQAHTEMLALRGRLAPVRGELQYVRSTLRETAARREQLAGQRAKLEQQVVRARTAQETARAATSGTRAGLREPIAQREALAARVAEARGALSALEQERASIDALRESRRTALARLEERINARRREAQARSTEIEAAVADRARLSAEAAALAERVAGGETALAPLRERLRSLAHELDELEPLQAGTRTRLGELERRSLTAENEVHRRAQDLERLREEMLEEGFIFEEPEPESAVPAGTLRPVVQTSTGARPLEAIVAERVAVVDATELQERVRSLRARIRTIGAVNPAAEVEYEEAKERHDFLTTQVADLREAETGLQEAIAELRHTIREQFRETFHRVNADFQNYFKTFFGGGNARLILTEPEDYGESGVDIVARPPGKRLQSLTLLSGGERSMTAVALLFALLESNPAPFCVLDEVDAALDEANVSRFGDALKELATRTQFVVITHNRGTIQAADTIYGVSMAADGVSSVLSLRLGDVPA
ncbi:MAG: chromosome segregation protein SMC [Dehalococcoidia bacterium]